ncbi:substrate-binding domain-containing protein [Conexibacter woesei]|uniref:Uncharacterized protein n=1 Tax=Conexibacter woesei (strain DSM 14684 / CCUG 47730 / CIP 108061 / JCM 11494 / NBRC 100937 / ID131577) TaxID=469383 RepID=D3F5N3_CONWI|nr:hypothetical protein [Conexibacter woesei]ADB52582.1 hypothetical protein Cwoe_4167 [Conexibacter woesei DSM 14684]
MPRRFTLPLPALAAAAALALTGCGTVGEDRPEVEATLVLPGAPSAVDAGIATAVERGFDGAEGVHLRVRPPRAAAGPEAGARALADGRADFAVLPAEALRSRPALVGIMAITSSGAGADQRPALVLSTSRRALEQRPSVARATVRALLRGYDMALTDPASSVSDLQALFPALPRARLDAQLDRLGGAIFPPGRQMGALPDGPQYEPGIVAAAASATHNP